MIGFRSLRSNVLRNSLIRKVGYSVKANDITPITMQGSAEQTQPDLASDTVTETSSTSAPTSAPASDIDGDSDLPWYLRENTSSPLLTPVSSPLPEIPHNAPTSIKPFLELLSKEYGLLDIKIFETHPEGIDSTDSNALEYMIVCTGKSDKHIYKAANELRVHIKKESNGKIIPKLEGFVSHSSRNTNYRRMIRRARKGPMATDNDYGTPANSWIMCDTETDGIFIHILTESRRKELDLEELWGEKSAEPKNPSSSVSTIGDDFFIGIKREFHTRTAFRRNYSSTYIKEDASIPSIYDQLLAQPSNISAMDLSSFVTKSSATDISDANTKFMLYKAIHLLDPNLVSYQQVIDTIWEKHILATRSLDEAALSKLRKSDSIEVMKFLSESTGGKPSSDEEDSRQQSDILLDRLSKFLRQLYLFSPNKISAKSIASSPEFLSLLWGFVVVNKDNFIGPNTIDNVHSGSSSEIRSIHNEISVYRARGILDLIELNGIPTTIQFDELVLFTFGNSNLNSMFWDQWEKNSLLYLNELTPKQLLTQWVRLITYLSIRNNLKFQLEFFNKHWDGESSIKGNFLRVLSMNKGEFSSEEEKRNFQMAMVKIVMNIRETTNDNAYESVIEFIRNI